MMNVQVGIVGLGAMGWRMAKRLHSEGWHPRVFDSDAEVLKRFDAEFSGAESSLDALGSACDIVITMLPNGQIVREVLLGAGGVIAGIKPGSTIIDMSSSDAVDTESLSNELAKLGIPLIDAPVSGGRGGAESGQLSIMAGTNDDAALERCWPLLSVLGRVIFKTGRSGSGHAAKAINNFLAATHNLAATEGVLMGRRFGLSPEMLLQIVNASSGRSAVTEVVFPNQILTRKFANGFSIGLMAKDTALAASLARKLNMDAPVSQLVESIWAAARDQQGYTADFTEVYRFMEERNGLAE